MSFESVYRTKSGTTEINKIANFIGSLVIKNNYEAEKGETSESLSEYIKYHGAYTKTDSFADYTLDDRRKYKSVVFEYFKTLPKAKNMSMGLLNSLTENRIATLEAKYGDKVPEVIDYLKGLRVARIYLYDEKNLYYRQFLGIPNKDSERVLLVNMDVGENGGYVKVTDYDTPPDPNVIYYTKIEGDFGLEYKSLGYITSWYDEETGDLSQDNFFYQTSVYAHEIKKNKYPSTYNYYILQQHINEVIEKYPDYNYLRFVGDDTTPFYIRKLSNYSIIKYNKSIFSQTELTYFFKAYDKARKQVVLDYINGFDSKQPLYNLLMIQNLLYYTVINYSASYIEKYSVGIYTEENCDDILRSYGYHSLTKIKDFKLKQRIIRNLNELISYKGSNKVLDLILNKILQDPDSELKRYYLEKKYNNHNDDASIEIDTSRGLEKSVSLVFREVPALSINELSTSADKYQDYDNFVKDDDLWGGIDSTDKNSVNANNKIKTKKDYIKNKLLSSDFDSILTKYITLTRTVDILDTQRKIRDAVYLMLKYFSDNDSDTFFKQKYDFNDFSTTPAALFAAISYLEQMKHYSDPDQIITDSCVINSSVVFRQMGFLAVDKTTLENNVFIVDGKPVQFYDISPDIASWKLLDYIRENPDIFEDPDVYDEIFRNYIEKVTSSDNEHHTIIETTRLSDIYDEYNNLIEKGILGYGEIAADGYKRLVDGIEDIEDYLVRFRFFDNGIDLGEVTSDLTFGELFSEDYAHQYPNLIRRINEKMCKCYDYREYQAWAYMLEQSRTNNSISFIFKGHTKFTDFIKSMESESLLDYINTEIKQYRPITNDDGISTISVTEYQKIHNTTKSMDDICRVQNELTTTFKKWVTEHFSSLIYEDEMSSNTISNTSYVEDMKILLDEFLSVFSQLYSIDYKYTFGNKNYDGLHLQLFYNPLFVTQHEKLFSDLTLSYWSKQRCFDKYEDKILLKFIGNLRQFDKFIDNINNNLEYDSSTNEYKTEDQFAYEEYMTYCKCHMLGHVDLTVIPHRLKECATFTDMSCKLEDVLAIKTDLGEKIYHEKTS